MNERYALPSDSSAIAYSKRALAVSPGDDYSAKMLENSVAKGKEQVHRAIAAKDFAQAHRVANAMSSLLPDRSDVAALKGDIVAAERAQAAARRPPSPAVATPSVSYRVYHMHTDKSPADNGPNCTGTLSVTGNTMKFVGQSATAGQPHNFEFVCAEIKEIKKNRRVASHENGFHVRTVSDNYNFVPLDSSPLLAAALSSACGK